MRPHVVGGFLQHSCHEDVHVYTTGRAHGFTHDRGLPSVVGVGSKFDPSRKPLMEVSNAVLRD